MNNILAALRNHPFRTAFVAVLIIGLFIGYRQLTGYQQLAIDFKGEPDSGAIKVYAVDGESKDKPETLVADQTPVRETTTSSSFRMRKGTYVVVGGDSPDYQKQLQKVTLDKDPVTVVVDPPYSKERLARMLPAEQPAIQSAIKQTVPTIGTKYLVATGELYGRGEWYGTVLYPNLTPEQRRLQYVDVYRVVLKKEGDVWKVVTMPPEIVLSAVTYPSIPRDILISVNDQKQPN